MAKRKLSDEADLKFVHEAKWSEETKTIGVEIKDFLVKIDDLENKKKPIHSPSFKLADKELGVYVYPGVYRRENSGEFISVYLANKSKESVTVTVTFKSSSGGKYSRKKCLIEAGLGLGLGNFLSHDDFKKWARENDDIFRLEVEVTLHVEGPGTWTTESTKPKLTFDPIQKVSMMWDNNNEEDFTDFTILSKEGTRFPCHRVILGSQSAPMKAMMIRDTKEKQEGEVQLLYGEDVVRSFLGSFYGRKIPQQILEGNLESFLTLSDSYDMADLKLEVEEAAVQLLSTENMLDMFYWGDLYHFNQLKDASQFLIERNKNNLKEMDLSRFPADFIATILRLIC